MFDLINPSKALEGFIRSNNTTLEKIFKKSTEKGEFYFFKKESRKIKVSELLEGFAFMFPSEKL